MRSRIKLGLSIIFGKDLIIYEKNTKIIVAMIGGEENIPKKGLDFAIDKYIQENNDEMRYLGGK